jgi:Uncharacterized membrane protein (homolog of Drosophila rhomboid)
VSESLPQRLDRWIARAGFNLLLPPLILLIPWLQELVDQLVFGGNWNLPMTPGGSFLGVLTAPFSHSGFGHLLANSLTFLPLSWLVLLRGRRDYLAVWLGVYATAIPVWLLWPNGSHGLSGVVYGLLGYLLLIGWLEKRPPLLAPFGAGIGHLCGGTAKPAADFFTARGELDRPSQRFWWRPAGRLCRGSRIAVGHVWAKPVVSG